jgi:acyl transferase domain-containing protein/acyl carrier protein
MCQTVRFAEGIAEVLKEGTGIVLEVGCGQSLSSFVKQHGKYAESKERVVVGTIRHEWERVSDEEVLSGALGKLWLSGIEIDWERYYEDEQRRRVQLPTYPFERQRYWIEPRQSAGSSTLNHLDKNPNLSEWFYVPVWKQSVPLVLTEGETRESKVWLVMTDGSSLAAKLVQQIESTGDEVVCVTPGDQFNRISDSSYKLNPRQRDDFDQLLRELSDAARIPHRIVHLWNLAPCNQELSHAESTEATLNLGFYSLMFLMQALGDLGIDETNIIIVSSEMQKVTGDETILPEKSTLLGPCRVIPQEFTNIKCRCVDVIPPVPESRQEEELSRRLFSELNRDSSDALIAYRGQQRWVQSFEKILLPALTTPTPRFRTGGTYLITGGVGGIGLAMAEHLARSAQANLILVGRSGLPERERWTELLTDEHTCPSLAQKIAQVAALEEMGSQVVVLSADVGDLEQMREVVRQGEERCGRIDGVIHAAGVPGEGLIQLKTEEAAASVLRPKVQGTLVLEEVFKDHSLDFLVLISSMNTVTGGGPGQLDYCAANAFLDGFAHANSENPRHTVSINWGEWQWNAWEKGLEGFDPEIQAFFRENRRKIGISFVEGMDALERILTAGLSQSIVSTQNFHAVIEGSKSFTVQQILQEAAKSRDSGGPTHSRPVLGTAYVAPTNEVEQTIADIWQDILGIQQVGIQDNFFELGGHSLLATQLFSRLRRLYDVKLSLRSIFEMPTITDQAQMIEALRWNETDPSLLLAPQGGPEEGIVEGEL